MRNMINAIILVSLSFNSYAAKPISITFESESTLPDGTKYAFYTLRCSDGTELKMTAWDDRKKWCYGERHQNKCERKQIKIAKQACK